MNQEWRKRLGKLFIPNEGAYLPEVEDFVEGLLAEELQSQRSTIRKEIEGEIEKLMENVDKRFNWEGVGKELVEFTRGKGWGWLYALDEIAGILKDSLPSLTEDNDVPEK